MKNTLGRNIIIGALITLLGLSAWQVSRLLWKNEIIAKLDAEYAKTPQNYIYNFNALNKLGREETPIRYGQVKGEFNHAQTMLFGPKPHEGEMGYHVLTPLNMVGGSVLVHRGWISKENKKSLDNDISLASTEIIGMMRRPQWNSFTPNNSPENDVWSKLDIEEIAGVHKIANIAPVILYAETKTNEKIIPQIEKWYPRNKHLYYAIFWFTMALALLAVIVKYQRQQKI